MTNTFQCWHCGKSLQVIMPFSRREVCDACNADQHVCHMCQHYDPHISDQCREDRAERVTDKEKANFCDYFKPMANAYKGGSVDKEAAAKAKLEALFGNSNDNPSDDYLSGPIASNNSPQDKNEAARKALEDLFNPPKSDD